MAIFHSNSMAVIYRMARDVCALFFFKKKKDFAYRQKRIPCDRREVSTAHRKYFLARGSRPSYRLKTESQTQCEANSVSLCKKCLSFSRIMSHSHSSLLDLPPFLSPTTLSFSASTIAVTINHRIHGQQDRLVVWSYKVRSQRPQGDTSTEFQPRSEHGLREADRTSRRNGRSHFLARLPALQLFPFGWKHVVGVDGTRRRQQQKEEALQLVVCSMWRQIRMESAVYWWCSWANANEAKVLKAHAAPLELCDNLITALKLLANQQKDGDSPIQSIVTGLHERSRRGIMDGQGRFIQAENHSAVDVGDLRRGTKSHLVQKTPVQRGVPEATIREGADELTLRADAVGTQKTFTNTEHIEFERWGPPQVGADWHTFCQAICKGTEGKEWEELYYHYREMSQATGGEKPNESQKARAFRTMEAAWDRSEEFYDPGRKEDILGGTKTCLDLWEEHLKDPIASLAKALESLDNPCMCWFLVRSLLLTVVAMACSIAGTTILQKM